MQIPFLSSIFSTWYSEPSNPFSWLLQTMVRFRLTPVRFRSTLARFRKNSVQFQSIWFQWIKMFQLHHFQHQFFLHQSTKKLNDKNFLLWRQQIKPTITVLGLNCFVANPQIPPRYLSDANHDLDHVNPLFLMWQKQDKFMLVWLQSPLSSLILARVPRSTHLYQV